MNKFSLRFIVLLLIGSASSLFGNENSDLIIRETSIKARVAAFFPISNRFTKIYDHTLPCYQVEVTSKFFRNVNIWGNGDWIGKNGRSNRLNYFTSIQMFTYSVGFSLDCKVNDRVTLYAGIGPCGACTQIRNRHVDERRKITKNSIGFLAKSGMTYDIDCHLFVDLFVDYFYQPKQFRTHVQMGGVKTGAGIGFKF